MFDFIADKSYYFAISIEKTILNINPYWIFLVCQSTAILYLIGGRFKRFTKPERPVISPIIRFVGYFTYLIGVIATFILMAVFLINVVLLAIYGFASGYTATGILHEAIVKHLWYIKSQLIIELLGGLFGVAISLFVTLRLIPLWERGEGLYNTKELVAKFKKFRKFNPLDYVDVERGCFIGLDDKKIPIYIPWRKIRETHIQVLGSTGCGKGVLLSLIAYQAILAGETVIFVDPKFDRYSPRVLMAAARKANKKFHIINLNPDQLPQINPISGASAHEIEELLVSGFDLKNTGTDGDYHRGRDEDAAIQTSRLAISKNAMSIPELVKICSEVESITGQENFWRKLLKLADLKPLATKNGLELDIAIKNGDVIYIVGSTDNERVKMLQKMLIVRVNQIIKSQDRFGNHQNICIVLDEFKHLLSPAALTGLGAIRDFDAHCLLAHQSMGDLSACPNISKEEAEGVVKDTTAIKIVYKIGDTKYAEELSLASGKRPVFVEQSNKNINDDGHAQGGWREEHVALIASDLITNLPMPSDNINQASTGIIFGVSTAKLFHVSPILVSGKMPTPNVVEGLTTDLTLNAEEII